MAITHVEREPGVAARLREVDRELEDLAFTNPIPAGKAVTMHGVEQ
jgi:hypothetical protein